VHVTGIHFPWELASSRLFYFRTWQDALIAHCPRDWAPGARHQYGVVGIILAVRALELLSGRNYWSAMEDEVFGPLGIADALPGGTGFSAENLARIGVLLSNHGRYGPWELFSEQTHRSILPTQLKPHFPDVDLTYGIGLRDASGSLGPGSYGHGGGCGTQLLIAPEKQLVFAMVRNEPGEGYREHLARVLGRLRRLGS
jgi:CubicO group peptidase (beta-lactamase class C family)